MQCEEDRIIARHNATVEVNKDASNPHTIRGIIHGLCFNPLDVQIASFDWDFVYSSVDGGETYDINITGRDDRGNTIGLVYIEGGINLSDDEEGSLCTLAVVYEPLIAAISQWREECIR